MRALRNAVVGLAAMAACSAGWADGCFMPTEASWKVHRERSLVTEPTQKAMVMLRNGLENLVISPGFTGNAADFAWVIPVPKRPQVDIVKGALFHELARLIQPEPPLASAQGMGGRSAHGTDNAESVKVLERKTVGAYDVSVLSATDSGALMRWLKKNRYHLPPAAQKPMAQYIREGWTFVACRVKVPRDAAGLATGTLAPLKLAFPSKTLIYPMRLSAANPSPFDVLVYVVTERKQQARVVQAPRLGGEVVLPASFVRPPGAPRPVRFQETIGALRIPPVEVNTTFKANPTIVGLTMNRRFTISAWGSPAIPPAACTKDFVWSVG